MHAYSEGERISTREACQLSRIQSDFAAEIATDVWLGTLSEKAARAVLRAYAMACHRAASAQALLSAALMREYRRCRERQDICS